MPSSSNEPQAPTDEGRQRLTAGRCLFNFLYSSVWGLWCSAYALDCIFRGDKPQALLFLFLALAQLIEAPKSWKRYQFVRKGGVLYHPRNDLLRLPTVVSVVFAVILTLVVVLATGVSVAILGTPIARQALWVTWSITVAVNVLLWSYVVYCWYRVKQDRRKRKPLQALWEPQDGVWPPPPTSRP